MPISPAITIQNLRKTYGSVEVLKGIDLEIQSGEIFALLGPNGAGKTTTIEILEGHRAPTSGSVSVLGFVPTHRDQYFRERIGIVLQETTVDGYLTVRETVDLFGSYYSRPRDTDEILELVGLESQKASLSRKLSGGQKRRLDVAVGLIGNPEILFLDEPTTGFDPQARRAAWEMVRGLEELGCTVVLTTHYMEEAEFLANRIAIMADGQIIASETTSDLRRKYTGSQISFQIDREFNSIISEFRTVEDDSLELLEDTFILRTSDPTASLYRLTSVAKDNNFQLNNLVVRQATLEDIYLSILDTHQRN
jgi:ABC-2 type transport system ATP-binding protein